MSRTLVLLTAFTAAVMATLTGVALAADAAECPEGFAWGEWSVPINTLLLIILALIHTRTKRKVDEVAAVTEKVKLRKTDTLGTARRDKDH